MRPSEFYRKLRPESFSDSETITKAELTREILEFELSKISTDQKQDLFETLCRRVAEKCIAPNLIPQVGPTGGGDGKVDSETYPVSQEIIDRWFHPQGWKKGEKWAFAFSAKSDWKSKVKSDVKKIVETKRNYTKIYFISNQKIPAKKKQDTKSELLGEYNIEVILLDTEWLLEKIYNENLINIAVESLNLSDCFKNEKKLGKNDLDRIEELKQLENNLANESYYFEHDFQKVDDALRCAVLSRMLEEAKDKTVGRFNRVLRYLRNTPNKRQEILTYYQSAWTNYNFLNDIDCFIDDYKKFKSLLDDGASVETLENYSTLVSLVRALDFHDSHHNLDIQTELTEAANFFEKLASDETMPNKGLVAKTHFIIHQISNDVFAQRNADEHISELNEVVKNSINSLNYPFESFKNIVEAISQLFVNNEKFDDLLETIAEISAKRNSELVSAEIYLNRGIQKLDNEQYKAATIFLGKAVGKLAKEESYYDFCIVLGLLGTAYAGLGLLWAANNCYISAFEFSFKTIESTGIMPDITRVLIQQLIKNELLIGRPCHLFNYYQILLSFFRDSKEDEEFNSLNDACLGIRIMHLNEKSLTEVQYLPDILNKLGLFIAEGSSRFKLGDVKNLDTEYGFESDSSVIELFEQFQNQDFVTQMHYETNFLNEKQLELFSNVLGCNIKIYFDKQKEILYIAETILAFIESFFATMLDDVFSFTGNISINLSENLSNDLISWTYDEVNLHYNIQVNNFEVNSNNSDKYWKSLIEFVSHLLAFHFNSKIEITDVLKDNFEHQEINQRMMLVIQHVNFSKNLLGNHSKLFFDEWVRSVNANLHPLVRDKLYEFDRSKQILNNPSFISQKTKHSDLQTESIINLNLWDKALWKGFGFMVHPKHQFIIFLAYDNEDYGKKVFEQWNKLFNGVDKEDTIQVTIIKRINKNNPHWYRVHISKKIDTVSFTENSLIGGVSRIHTMTPDTSENLNHIIQLFEIMKSYILIPYKMPSNVNEAENIEDFIKQGIKKTHLSIVNATDIEEHDFLKVAIRPEDDIF